MRSGYLFGQSTLEPLNEVRLAMVIVFTGLQ